MSEHPGDFDPESPAAIEREIDATRARLGSTLDAIEQRLSPDHLMEQAMSYLREEAEEWGTEIGSFVRRNPLPVALLGLGIGWLTVSLLRGQHDEADDVEYAAGPEGLYGPAYDGELADEIDPYDPDRRVGRSSSAQGYVSSALNAARSGIADRAADIGHRVSDRAHDARQRVSDGFGNVSDRARDIAESARERVSHAASDTIDQAREQATHWGEVARGGVDRIGSEIVRVAEERPLVLGAVGLGIGALIGFCLPATRAEARLIGPRRDELLDELRTTGKERLHGLVEAVRDAGEAARDQAEKEGLSRRGVSQAMDKAQRVAEAALDTAQSEVESKVLGSEQETGAEKGGAGAGKPST